MVAAIGCGDPPAPSPSGSVVDFTGIWQGQYRVTACTGNRHCPAFIGMTRSFLLRLTQTGTYVTGVLSGDVTVNVAGPVAADGTLRTTSLKPAASQLDPAGEVEVQRFVIRLSPDTGLAGTLEYETRFTPSQNFETLRTTRAGEILSATRLASEPIASRAPFQGHWVGRYAVRSCTASGGGPSCTGEGRTQPFDLTLTQSGAAVSGALSPLSGRSAPVSGNASSNTLTLQGSTTTPLSGGFDIVSVTAWSTTTDGVGQMLGSFTYVSETHVTTGVNAGAVWSYTYDVDLVSVVLVP